MILLVAVQLGVLPAASTPQQSLVSGPTQMQVCVSTAVDVKTQTCNTECNSAWHSCPTACFCLAASTRSAFRGTNSAWRSLEPEDLEQLTVSLKRRLPEAEEEATSSTTAADAALRKAMAVRKLEGLLEAIHQNNGAASTGVLDEARALRDELREEKHAPTDQKVDTPECQEWCTQQSVRWPGRQARDRFCAKADCQGCTFCSQREEDEAELRSRRELENSSAAVTHSPPAPPAQPAWRSRISAARPARLLNEEIVGFCAPPLSCHFVPRRLPLARMHAHNSAKALLLHSCLN